MEHTNKGFAKLVSIYVLPLRDIYLESDMMGEWGPTGSMQSIYIFTTISFLLLIIACLNFINLTTARSLRRSKEAGMRKVLGANRFGLIKQFWGESVIITLFAVLISVIIYELLNPLLFSYFNVNINELNLLNTNFLLILIGIVVFVSLFTGMYPAIFLSKYKPVESLKGIKTPGSSASGLRKILVVLQFSISIFLLIGTAAIYKQLSFMLNSDPGFNKKNVLIVSFPVTSQGAVDKYAVIKNEFMSVPGVTDVSGVYSLPGVNNKEQQTFKIKGVTYNKVPVIQADGVDYNFIQTMGLIITEGRNFSEKLKTDAGNSIIINETAVKKFGLKNPVGTQVYLPQGKGEHLVTIIGVVKDFHITSFRNLIEPMFLYINPERYYNIAVKINSIGTKKIIASLQNKFKALFPAKGFYCETLAEKYGSMYSSEEKSGSLILIFTVLSVIVATMGLLGLTSFSTEVRIKEIGIRKVLGANLFNISFLLSKDFSKWVLIANVLAWPAAYFVISKWLEDFAYKTDIGMIIFIASGAVAFIIALVTISIQAINAASANPIKALHYE